MAESISTNKYSENEKVVVHCTMFVVLIATKLLSCHMTRGLDNRINLYWSFPCNSNILEVKIKYYSSITLLSHSHTYMIMPPYIITYYCTHLTPLIYFMVYITRIYNHIVAFNKTQLSQPMSHSIICHT